MVSVGASEVGAGEVSAMVDVAGAGVSIGTPAAAQISESTARTLAWSAVSLQADCTQGVSEGVNVLAFLHEQAKSVRSQPREGMAEVKHVSEQLGRSAMP